MPEDARPAAHRHPAERAGGTRTADTRATAGTDDAPDPSPAPPRGRQRRAVATRAAILEGAAREFDEHGYVGTSMDAVAVRAGVTKGALYFHFTSKADLAGAVVARQHEVSRAYGDAAIARGTTPLESVVWLSNGLAEQMTAEVVVSAGVRLSTDVAADEVARRDPYTDWLRLMTTLVTRAVASGEVDPRWDPAAVARVVNAAFTGVHTMSAVVADRTDLHERLRELWAVLLDALVTEATRPRIPALVAIIGRPTRERVGGDAAERAGGDAAERSGADSGTGQVDGE